jgi:hypothetical protein
MADGISAVTLELRFKNINRSSPSEEVLISQIQFNNYFSDAPPTPT